MKSKQFFRIIFYAMFLFVLAYCTDDDPVQYSLTITVTPEEGGTVTPISGMYNEGKEITLTAKPSKEYIFKKWVTKKDPNLTPNTVSSLQNPFLIMMNSDKTITAEFEKVNYSLTINIEGGGTVTQELILGKSTMDYPSGSQVKLTPIANPGYKFSYWSGELKSIKNPLIINISKPITITAVFLPEPTLYSLTINIEGDGKVSQELIGKSTHDYQAGSWVKLLAIPDPGWELLKWTGDYSGKENPIQIQIDKPKTITAIFIYTGNIIVREIGGGKVIQEIIQSSSTGQYPSGTKLKLTAVPDNGWTFINWSGDYIQNNQNPLTITVDKLMVIFANFELIADKIYIPDDHFEQALIDLGYDDMLDNYISKDKIKTVESLDISGKQISDLTGIEGFYNLSYLYCAKNKLSSVDLSKNQKLWILDLSDNQLTTIDLSNVWGLWALHLTNNKLTSLDISDCVEIEFLFAMNNQLSCIQLNQDQYNYVLRDGRDFHVDGKVIFSLNCN